MEPESATLAQYWPHLLAGAIPSLAGAAIAWSKSRTLALYYEAIVKVADKPDALAELQRVRPPTSVGGSPLVLVLLGACLGLLSMLGGGRPEFARVVGKSCSPPCPAGQVCESGRCVATAKQPPQDGERTRMADRTPLRWEDRLPETFPGRAPEALYVAAP